MIAVGEPPCWFAPGVFPRGDVRAVLGRGTPFPAFMRRLPEAVLPTSAEIARGGYEAESYLGKPWTGPLAPGIEDCIIADLTRR